MYTMHLSPFGEIILHLNTIHILGFNIYISGYDSNHNRIDFIMRKICYPEDSPFGWGYCHIVSYADNGTTTECDTYQSIY